MLKLVFICDACGKEHAREVPTTSWADMYRFMMKALFKNAGVDTPIEETERPIRFYCGDDRSPLPDYPEFCEPADSDICEGVIPPSANWLSRA